MFKTFKAGLPLLSLALFFFCSCSSVEVNFQDSSNSAFAFKGKKQTSIKLIVEGNFPENLVAGEIGDDLYIKSLQSPVAIFTQALKKRLSREDFTLSPDSDLIMTVKLNTLKAQWPDSDPVNVKATFDIHVSVTKKGQTTGQKDFTLQDSASPASQGKDPEQMAKVLLEELFTKAIDQLVTSDLITHALEHRLHITKKNSKAQSKVNYLGILQDGDASYYYADESLKLEGQFDLGKRVGTWKGYHFNGAKKSSTPWLNDMRSGEAMTWHDNGQLASQGHFENNQMQDLWKLWYPNGKQDQIQNWKLGSRQGEWKKYFDTGQQQLFSQYDNNQLHGPQQAWYKSGKKHFSKHWVHDIKSGSWTIWHETGNIQEQGDYLKGRRENEWQFGWPNGNKKMSGSFINGIKDGSWKEWYENSQLQSQGIYVSGEPMGYWRFWFDDGRPDEVKNKRIKDKIDLTRNQKAIDFRNQKINITANVERLRQNFQKLTQKRDLLVSEMNKFQKEYNSFYGRSQKSSSMSGALLAGLAGSGGTAPEGKGVEGNLIQLQSIKLPAKQTHSLTIQPKLKQDIKQLFSSQASTKTAEAK